MSGLTRHEIFAALDELSRELRAKGEKCECLIVGGAALALRWHARNSTRDVDVCITGGNAASVREAAAFVAQRLGLPHDWINEGAKGFLHGRSVGSTVYSSENLVVSTPAVEQLLAMKLCAWRDELDVSDARLLLGDLQGDREQVWESVVPYLLPGRELKARYAYDDLWESCHGPA